jgi:hypothetical protein
LGADGSDYGLAADQGLSASFEDPVEGEAKIFAAEREEAEGVSVAVKGGFGYFVFAGDGPGAAPLQEVAFDGFAFGVAADLAFAAVAFGGGLAEIGVWRWRGAVSISS